VPSTNQEKRAARALAAVREIGYVHALMQVREHAPRIAERRGISYHVALRGIERAAKERLEAEGRPLLSGTQRRRLREIGGNGPGVRSQRT
jgi:hypothetical protein